MAWAIRPHWRGAIYAVTSIMPCGTSSKTVLFRLDKTTERETTEEGSNPSDHEMIDGVRIRRRPDQPVGRV